MRVAVLVLGIVLPLLLIPATLLGWLASSNGIVGMVAGIVATPVWWIGAAFSLGKPKASMVLFIVAGMLSFLLALLGSLTTFGLVWTISSLVMALLSYFGVRELAEKRAREERPLDVRIQRSRPIRRTTRRQMPPSDEPDGSVADRP